METTLEKNQTVEQDQGWRPFQIIKEDDDVVVSVDLGIQTWRFVFWG